MNNEIDQNVDKAIMEAGTKAVDKQILGPKIKYYPSHDGIPLCCAMMKGAIASKWVKPKADREFWEDAAGPDFEPDEDSPYDNSRIYFIIKTLGKIGIVMQHCIWCGRYIYPVKKTKVETPKKIKKLEHMEYIWKNHK